MRSLPAIRATLETRPRPRPSTCPGYSGRIGRRVPPQLRPASRRSQGCGPTPGQRRLCPAVGTRRVDRHGRSPRSPESRVACSSSSGVGCDTVLHGLTGLWKGLFSCDHLMLSLLMAFIPPVPAERYSSGTSNEFFRNGACIPYAPGHGREGRVVWLPERRMALISG